MNNTEYGYVLLDQFSRQFYNQTTVRIDGYMVDYTPWCTLSVDKNNTTTTSSNPSGAMCILFTVKLTNGTIVGNETYWEPPPLNYQVFHITSVPSRSVSYTSSQYIIIHMPPLTNTHHQTVHIYGWY